MHRKGRVFGYERMAYRWILLVGNMLIIACFGSWEHVSSCYFFQLYICWDQARLFYYVIGCIKDMNNFMLLYNYLVVFFLFLIKLNNNKGLTLCMKEF